jgi:hypothetical protein
MPKHIKKVRVVKTPNGVKRVQPKQVPVKAQQAQAMSTNLAIIDDMTAKAILADPRYLQAVPCLQNSKVAWDSIDKKCSRCDRRRKAMQTNTIKQIKNCIAGLKGEAAVQFKALMGVKQVRVMQTAGKGSAPTPVTI